MNWLNALASLIDMVLALCIDWISLSYDKDRRATDERETARARQGASLEAARAAAQAEAARASRDADRLAAARSAIVYAEGATEDDLAEAINRELN